MSFVGQSYHKIISPLPPPSPPHHHHYHHFRELIRISFRSQKFFILVTHEDFKIIIFFRFYFTFHIFLYYHIARVLRIWFLKDLHDLYITSIYQCLSVPCYLCILLDISKISKNKIEKKLQNSKKLSRERVYQRNVFECFFPVG